MSDKKPVLLVKLGHDNFLQGYPWVPSEEDLRKTQAYFEKYLGDRFTIMVWHRGIELQVLDGDANIAIVEVKTLDELREDLTKDVEPV